MPGQIYLLTTTTHRRQPVFRDFGNARRVIHALRQEDRDGVSSTIAFVIMPDHMHWLVRLERGTLPELMRRVKGRSSRWISAGADCNPLWQTGYHDHAIRVEESLLRIARYVVANPLRAGLCGCVGEYPHWDAAWLYGSEFLPYMVASEIAAEAAPT